ncbi:MAG: hypothetical protein WC227_02240 [Patescibacteria group bacterium]
MKRIDDLELLISGPACQTLEEAKKWIDTLANDENNAFIPALLRDFNLFANDLPNGKILLSGIALVIPSIVYSATSTIQIGSLIYPLVNIDCSAIIAGRVMDDNLDEMLEVLSGLNETTASAFAASIAGWLSTDTYYQVRRRAEYKDDKYADAIAQVFALLEAPPEAE